VSRHKVERWRTPVYVQPELREDETACRAFIDHAIAQALEDCVKQGHRVVRPPEGEWQEPNALADNEFEREWWLFIITIGVLGEEVTA
jgi:hypothetical protein